MEPDIENNAGRLVRRPDTAKTTGFAGLREGRFRGTFGPGVNPSTISSTLSTFIADVPAGTSSVVSKKMLVKLMINVIDLMISPFFWLVGIGYG